jgi:LysR family glycine cleavage system transcriptional activator
MSHPLIRLNALKAFEASARRRSFAAAATELGVTAAAVGQQVRLLESWLGLRLFHREREGLSLTDEGALPLPDIRDGFERIAMGLARLRERERNKTLTVSVPPSFAAKWLLPRIETFRAAHPGVDLRLDATERLADFRHDGVDLAIRYGRGAYPGLTVIRLLEEEVFPVCSPSLLDGGLRLAEPRDLRRAPLIHDATISFDDAFPTWGMWLRAADVEGVDESRGLHLNSSLLATQAAVDGQGVALGRSVVVADDLATGRLARPFGPECPLGLAYFLVYPRTAFAAARTAAFREWILAEAERWEKNRAKAGMIDSRGSSRQRRK